jgi:glutathione reductase (NADPH)
MSKQGIDLRFNAEIAHIGKQGNDYLITLTDDEESVVICDCAMAAIGRVPETGKLDLPHDIKLKTSGHIEINDRYQTSIPHIYAIGDVTGRIELTPVAIREGHWLADTLFSDIDRECIVYHQIPTAVFSRPQIGTVGITEDEAKECGFDVEIYKSTFNPLAYTLAERNERSFMKMIVDKKTQKVLGLHICGMDAAEMTQGFAVAIKMGATKACFDETIGIHPTSAEEVVTMK